MTIRDFLIYSYASLLVSLKFSEKSGIKESISESGPISISISIILGGDAISLLNSAVLFTNKFEFYAIVKFVEVQVNAPPLSEAKLLSN